MPPNRLEGCRTPSHTTARPPHLDRAALVLATLLLTWITDRFTTTDVANNLLLLIETEHALRSHRDAGTPRTRVRQAMPDGRPGSWQGVPVKAAITLG